MSTTGNKLMDDLTDAFSEAAKKNADAWKQGFDMLKQTMKLPYDLSLIVSESSVTLTKGFADYLRLNVEHTSHLLDLGRALSGELLSSLERSGWQTKSSTAEQPRQGQTVSELYMKGSPCDLCRSAFILESNKSTTVLARVFHSRFINQANDNPVTIPVNIDPVEVAVAPNQKIRISLEAGIPENIPSGTYQSMVWIDGFAELSLRVLLNVMESKETENPLKESKITSGQAQQNKSKSKKRTAG
jgi:hypothetical protein